MQEIKRFSGGEIKSYLTCMNQAEKRFISEIDTLLTKAATFKKRYKKGGIFIDSQLYEDLLFFTTRARFVWTNLNKEDFIPFANHFELSHARLDKSETEEFDDGSSPEKA